MSALNQHLEAAITEAQCRLAHRLNRSVGQHRRHLAEQFRLARSAALSTTPSHEGVGPAGEGVPLDVIERLTR